MTDAPRGTALSTAPLVHSADNALPAGTRAATKSDDCLEPSTRGQQASDPSSVTDPSPNRHVMDTCPTKPTGTSAITMVSAAAEAGQAASVSTSGRGGTEFSRKASPSSVSFRLPRDPRLPQGTSRGTTAARLRNSSPTCVRFRQRVGFDNLPAGEATKSNTASLTLNSKHEGYHPKRRSRTFMVGLDVNSYSDYALAWLLENMIDDGDEVICVRVVDANWRGSEKYQEEARKMLKGILEKNKLDRAISIVLEYAVGKLHDTFQQLIQIYQPSMLIVGTKGRSLGGLQGLVPTNSFSKYSLQYSPVPVVVVRPDYMRQKKKDKRTTDPNRQSYNNMLAQQGGKHEIDSEASSVYELEKVLSADEEAHRVAAAIGLPAAFDPTIKPYKGGPSRASSSPFASPNLAGLTSNQSPPLPPPPESTEANDSGEDESGEEAEYEAEAVSANHVPQTPSKDTCEEREMQRQQKRRLHAMEVGEAKALLKSGAVLERQDKDEDEEEEEDDDSQDGAIGSTS